MHEFLDLGPDARVSEMLLQSRGVVLGLLQDALHDRVLEDADDLALLLVMILREGMVRLTSGSR